MKHAILIALAGLLIGCSGQMGGFDIGQTLSGLKDIAGATKSYSSSQEHQVGRALSAQLMGEYPPYRGRANTYIQQVGSLLAAHSDRPAIYNGYHFQVLDSKQINAFAAPSGFIFITKGILDMAESEDEIAGVLAHELGHVRYKHALNVVRPGGVVSGLTKLGSVAVKRYGNSGWATAANLLDDRVSALSKTLLTKGFGRSAEHEADEYAVTLMYRAGYNPSAYLSVLEKLKSREGSASGGLFSTHPDTEDRISNVSDSIEDLDLSVIKGEAQRKARFKKRT